MYRTRFIFFILLVSFLPVFRCLATDKPHNESTNDLWTDKMLLIETFESLKIDRNNYSYNNYDDAKPESSEIHGNFSNIFDGTEFSASGCQFDIKQFPQKQPLLRNPKNSEIFLPDNVGSSIITLETDSHIELDCPGSKIVVNSRLTLGETEDAICVSETVVRIGNDEVKLNTVECSRRIASIARYTGNKCWRNSGDEIEVGFQFSDGYFIRQLTTCFDPNLKDVYYSLFDLIHQIGNQNTGGTRPGWTEGDFYKLGTKLNQLYPHAHQRTTINRLVGLPDGSTKYVKATGSYYLAKGHLTARSDFMYYAQQEATFHYINSAPQWHTLNAFNWAYVERDVRGYAANRQLDLTIMTGGYGISTLPHEQTGEPVELFLFADESSGQKAVPVPALFWKVIYSQSTQQGVAILGINNPFLEDTGSQLICPDIADQLTWLKFDRTAVTRGFVFACTIDDLRKVIPEIPNYRVTGVLN